MKTLVFKAVAAVSLFTATSAFADTITVETVGAKDSAGDYIGPYGGKFDGVATNVYCDDLLHNIGITSTPTNVNVSTIANLSLTRFGGASASTALVAVADYEQIFYLSTFLSGSYAAPSSFYGSFSGGTTSANTTVQADIQDAMWSFYDSSAPNNGTNQVKYWLTQAQNNYAKYNYSSYKILTDSSNQYNGVQELFVTTSPNNSLTLSPEPGTIGMLFGGLAAVAYGARRRSRSNSVS